MNITRLSITGCLVLSMLGAGTFISKPVLATQLREGGETQGDSQVNKTNQIMSPMAGSADIVISQVYGGGGAASGTPTYVADYVELFNTSSVATSLNGLSLQYGSATGQFGSSTSNIFALPNVILNPGQYYLVQLGTATAFGSPISPAPDATTTNLNMSGSNGKVALANQLTALGCGATATPCALPNAAIRDLVSYGTANNAEGGIAVGALTTVTGAIRNLSGCQDTDVNGSDFTVVTAPVPRNSASPLNPCSISTSTPTPTPTLTPTPTQTPTPTPVPVSVSSVSNLWPDKNQTNTFASGGTLDVYAQVYAAGVTDPSGQGAGIECQVFWSPVSSFGGAWISPEYTTTMTYNADIGSNDEYKGTLGPLSAGLYEYTARCEGIGANSWVYVSDGTNNGKITVTGPTDTPTPTPTTTNTPTPTNTPTATATPINVCAAPVLPIGQVQGTTDTTPYSGTVVSVRGVVIGDYEGASPNLRGWYIQDAGDGDPATSDGIYVFDFDTANDQVVAGHIYSITGTATEFSGQTQLTNYTLTDCGASALPTPVDVTLPFSSSTYLERYEGMLVRLPQDLTLTNNFYLGRFSEVGLSSGGRLWQPTNIVAPGAAAIAQQAANDLNYIQLDDALNNQNPDPVAYGGGTSQLSFTNTLRGGYTVSNLVGVMSYNWAGNAASPNAYRIRPVVGYTPNFVAANPRPTPPPFTGANVVVAAGNVLNYFNTFGVGACTGGVGGAATDCRGASNSTEFARQWPKTVRNIVDGGADVFAFMEMENDGYGAGSAIQDLLDKLNADAGAGTYAFINPDTTNGTNSLGTDAIKVGMFYKPAKVTPAGTTAALNTTAFVNGGDTTQRNRPALAQAFQIANGEKFIVAVNHLKSKGSACDAADTGDGQGNCAVVRTNAANTLTSWLNTDPTGTGDPDRFIVGDLNSYAMEDPITAIKNAGYTNLISQYMGTDGYSYQFDGQWGYLDHALASNAALTQVVGLQEWHINSDEPVVLDYTTDFKSTNQLSLFYGNDEYRSSDHDPVLIGLNLQSVVTPTPTPTQTPTQTPTSTPTQTPTLTPTPTATPKPLHYYYLPNTVRAFSAGW